MPTARYALTLVFDIDFMTSPSHDGVREHFEDVARSAVENYSTRTVTGTEVQFVSVSLDAAHEAPATDAAEDPA